MSEKLKITIAYERGKCYVCEETTQVRLIMDENKICKICKKCVGGIGDKSTSEILCEYGKERGSGE